jgi:hypothetical protein
MGWTADHIAGSVLVGPAESTLEPPINTGRNGCNPIESLFDMVSHRRIGEPMAFVIADKSPLYVSLGV